MEISAAPSEMSVLPAINGERQSPSSAGEGTFANHLNNALDRTDHSGAPESPRHSKKEAPASRPSSLPGYYAAAGNNAVDASSSNLRALSSPSSLPGYYAAAGPNAADALSSNLRALSSGFEEASMAGTQQALSPASDGQKSSSPNPAGQPAGGIPSSWLAQLAEKIEAERAAQNGLAVVEASPGATSQAGTAPSKGTLPTERALQLSPKTGENPEPLAVANTPSRLASDLSSSQMEKALASLESIGMASLTTAPAVDKASINTTLSRAATAPTSSAGRGKVLSDAESPRPASSKSSEDSSQGPTRGSQPSNSGASQTDSANGDSSAAAKAAPGPSSDNSKNASSQSNSGKPSTSATTQTVNGANPGANSASPASTVAQAVTANLTQGVSQTAGTNVASHAGTSTPSTNAPGAPGEKIAAAIDTPVNAQATAVNNAALVQSQGKAEMRVAMQTDSLGTLQLHAVLDNGRLGASIQVVGHDAHTLLSNDLPALQQVLTDQNLRVEHLAVINSPMTSGAGTGDRRNFHSEDFSQHENQNAGWISAPRAPVISRSSAETISRGVLRGRLNVRA